MTTARWEAAASAWELGCGGGAGLHSAVHDSARGSPAANGGTEPARPRPAVHRNTGHAARRTGLAADFFQLGDFGLNEE